MAEPARGPGGRHERRGHHQRPQAAGGATGRPGRRLAATLGVALLVGGVAAALASGEQEARHHGKDPEQLHALHERGEIRPLEAVVATAREAHPEGRLIEAELFAYGQRLIYEVEMLETGSGVLHELYFDARTGQRIEDDAAIDRWHHRGHDGRRQRGEGPGQGRRSPAAGPGGGQGGGQATD